MSEKVKATGKRKVTKAKAGKKDTAEEAAPVGAADPLLKMDEEFELAAYVDGMSEDVVIDPYDGTQQIFRGHRDAIRAIAVDADRGVMYSASWDETVLVWSLLDASQLGILPHGCWVNALQILTYTPSAAAAAVAASAASAEGKLLGTIGLHAPRVATGAEDGNVTVWGTAQTPVGKEYQTLWQLRASHGPVTCMALDPDENFLFAASLTAINAIHLATGTAARVYQTREDVNAVAAHDEHLFAACDDGVILVFDIFGGFVLREMASHKGPVRGLLLLEDSNMLVSCGDDATVKLWTLSTGACQRTFTGHRKSVRCVGLRSGERERFIYSASIDGSIRCTRLATGKGGVVRNFTANAMVLLANAHGRYRGELLAGDYAGRIYCFPLRESEMAVVDAGLLGNSAYNTGGATVHA